MSVERGQQARSDGTGGLHCPSCGWLNPTAARSCSFCTALLPERAEAVTESPECPHCGAVSPGADRNARCPRCGRGYHESVTQATRLLARSTAAAHGLRPSPAAIAVAGLLLLLVIALAFPRADRVDRSAERMVALQALLDGYRAENGAFPGNTEAAGIEQQSLRDGWGRPIRYRTQGDAGRHDAQGRPLFTVCELRSAGGNGRFDDGDDIVWQGRVER